MKLAYESLSRQLHQRFPQLAKQEYTSLVGNIDVDAEPFVLYGVIFNRYLVELANGDDNKSKKDVATFLEEMAASSDSHVTFLLTSELLPTLIKDQAMIDAFWPFLGDLTRHCMSLMPPRFMAKINLPTPN
ncbi:MAG TPA: hypothetical protein VGU67_06815 [Edaphobacter sp.]|nr:hypothetical protein [Edaphobacter sp.]